MALGKRNNGNFPPVVGGSGGSSHLDPSEPNSQKANGRKDRNGAFVA